MSAAAAQGSFLLYVRNGRIVNWRLIGVDDARLWMRAIIESLAEQPFGCCGIAQGRRQEVNGRACGIDGAIQIAPAALDAKVSLIDPPGFVGRLEMTPQPLFQFRSVTLNPTPDRGVIRRQTAFGE